MSETETPVETPKAKKPPAPTTRYRIMHQETEDPERWRLEDEEVGARSDESAIRFFLTMKYGDDYTPAEGDPTVYVAVPARSFKPRLVAVQVQMRISIS